MQCRARPVRGDKALGVPLHWLQRCLGGWFGVRIRVMVTVRPCGAFRLAVMGCACESGFRG